MQDPTNYSYKVYDNINEHLILEWKKLEENSNCNVFQTIDWVSHWYEYIGKNNTKELFIVFIFSNKTLIGIFPLCIKRSLFVNILLWTGYPFNDLAFPLISNGINLNKNIFTNIFKEIINKSKTRIDLVYLKNQVENNKASELLNPLTDFFKKKNIQDLNYYIDYSKKNIPIFSTRKLNKFNKIPKLDFIFDVTDKEERKRVIKFILDNKEIQFKVNKLWNFLKVKNYRLFLENISKNTIISYIKTNDNIIVAAHFGYKYKSIYYYILPVYNPVFHNTAPGLNLLNLLVTSLYSQNYKFLDLTIGSEIYKVNFSNSCLKIYCYYKYYSFLGFLYYLLFILFQNHIKKSRLYSISKKIYYNFKNE
jgi:CelD/BcsL family acetyltransferase involved in cellulose biosynthesis